MSCSGDCNQGRTCDCCEEVQLEPLSNWELISFYSILIIGVVFGIIALCAIAGFVYRFYF